MAKHPILNDSFLSELASTPGVYLMYDQRHIVIYVGKARNLKKRVTSYARLTGASHNKTKAMVAKINAVETILTRTEKEALILEASLIKKHKPNTILSSLTGANIMILLARKLSYTRTKIIIREACTLINIKNQLKLILAKILYKEANGIITVSEGIKTDLINHFNLNPDIIQVIYNPVSIETIKQLSKKNITKEYFSPQIKTIISVGRLVAQKDFKTLIKAFDMIHSEIAVQLIIIGEGNQRQELTELIHTLGLEKKVHLIGFKENPYKYMKHSDLFVLSSKDSWLSGRYPSVLSSPII